MKTLYLECSMGAAGDMLGAALLELMPNRAEMVQELNDLHIPDVVYSAQPSVRCGVTGTHLSVTVRGTEESEAIHDHPCHGMQNIRQIVEGLTLPAMVKLDILAVYQLIAEAESKVHGVPVEQIHFHEVGTLDAIADITAVCLMMHRLGAEEVVASPVHVGSGTVRCAHGILPVPAPATALLLEGIPIYGGTISSELCTPTGAALLRHFVTSFGPVPQMRVEKIGYGMGKKEFPQANCLRAMVGQSEQQEEPLLELCCNVDDMTGEAIGFALQELFAAGALEAYTTPVGMKKSRPGVLITVLCRSRDRERMAQELLTHTTTLGVREFPCQRHRLDREIREVSTPFGPVRKKISTGYGVRREKFEYEDLARIAREQGRSLAEIQQALSRDSDR